MRKNKGITLIALIITIIILLILVGVSLNLVIKGDLFGSAEKAVNGTNAKVEEEQSRVDELMDKLDKVQVHNWVKSGDSVSCNHCGLYLKIGQEIMYKDTGAETSTLTATKSGADEDQTIEKGSDVRWVVFGVEDTNKDGRNESLLLTTVKPTKTSVAWGNSELEYENGESELNRICKELYGNDARSITVEDINSTLGYKPTGAIYVKIAQTTAQNSNIIAKSKEKLVSVSTTTDTANNNVKYYTTGNFTTKLKDLEIWDDIKGIAVGNDGNTVEKYGDYIYNGYTYSVNTNGDIIEPVNSSTVTSVSNVTRDMIFGTNNGYIYPLASKNIEISWFLNEINLISKMFEEEYNYDTNVQRSKILTVSNSSTGDIEYTVSLGMANVSTGEITGRQKLTTIGGGSKLSKLLEENKTTPNIIQANYIKTDKNSNVKKTMVITTENITRY